MKGKVKSYCMGCIAKIISRINRFRLRVSGVKVGHGVFVPGMPYIAIGGGKIELGDGCHISDAKGLAGGKESVRTSFYTEPGATISIGANVKMIGTKMWIAKGLNIGDNVVLESGVLIIDTDCHPLDYRMRRHDASSHFTPEELQSAIHSAPIVIEDNVRVESGVTILKGVTIGANSTIKAGSVVTRSIPSNCIAGGNPYTKLLHQSETEQHPK